MAEQPAPSAGGIRGPVTPRVTRKDEGDPATEARGLLRVQALLSRHRLPRRAPHAWRRRAPRVQPEVTGAGLRTSRPGRLTIPQAARPRHPHGPSCVSTRVHARMLPGASASLGSTHTFQNMATPPPSAREGPLGAHPPPNCVASWLWGPALASLGLSRSRHCRTDRPQGGPRPRSTGLVLRVSTPSFPKAARVARGPEKRNKDAIPQNREGGGSAAPRATAGGHLCPSRSMALLPAFERRPPSRAEDTRGRPVGPSGHFQTCGTASEATG